MGARLKSRFIEEEYGGDWNRYRRERKKNYFTVQFAWSCWMDGLCKDGEITQEQYDNARF